MAELELAIAELSLPVLDRAVVEAAVLFVADEDRPLQGLAGFCDWRLCGALSRTLASGWYQGRVGETLLMPTGRRLGPARLFLFGVGSALGGAAAMATLLPHTFSALSRARIGSCALALPWPGMDLVASMELWAKHAAGGPPRQLLLGDGKSLQRWLESASLPWRPWAIAGLPEPSLRSSVPGGTISKTERGRSRP